MGGLRFKDIYQVSDKCLYVFYRLCVVRVARAIYMTVVNAVFAFALRRKGCIFSFWAYRRTQDPINGGHGENWRCVILLLMLPGVCRDRRDRGWVWQECVTEKPGHGKARTRWIGATNQAEKNQNTSTAVWMLTLWIRFRTKSRCELMLEESRCSSVVRRSEFRPCRRNLNAK